MQHPNLLQFPHIYKPKDIGLKFKAAILHYLSPTRAGTNRDTALIETASAVGAIKYYKDGFQSIRPLYWLENIKTYKVCRAGSRAADLIGLDSR